MSSNYYKYGTNLQDREFFTSTVNTPYGVKRYFSNIEGEIYFGNKLIEDIYKFDFVVEEKKLPLYGYNCFYPTIIVPGQRVVQGSFVLNFTNGNYLNDILNEIDNSILCNSILETEIYNPSNDERDKAIWPKSFDIMIGYGYYNTSKETYNATCQTICGAQIYNMQSVVDVSGEPIMEVYSFIAKDFINGDIDSTKKDDSSNNDSSSDSSNETKQNYYYADKNNTEDYNLKYTKYKNDKNAVSLLHDITFNIDKELIPYISVIITDFDGNVLKCSKASLLVTQQLNHNFIAYSLEKVKNNKFTLSFKNTTSEGNILNEAFKSRTKISCTLKYSVEINSEKHNIEYNGYLYIK